MTKRILKVWREVSAEQTASGLVVSLTNGDWLPEDEFKKVVQQARAAGFPKIFSSLWENILISEAGSKVKLTTPEFPLRMSGGVTWIVNKGEKSYLMLVQRTKTRPDGSPNLRPLVLDVTGGIHDQEFETWHGLLAGEAAETAFLISYYEGTSKYLIIPLIRSLNKLDKLADYLNVLKAELLRTITLSGIVFHRLDYVGCDTVQIRKQVTVRVHGEDEEKVVMALEADNLALEPRLLIEIRITKNTAIYDLEGQMFASDHFKPVHRPVLLINLETGETEIWKNGKNERTVSVSEIIREISEIPPEQRENLLITEKVEACINALPYPAPGLQPLLLP